MPPAWVRPAAARRRPYGGASAPAPCRRLARAPVPAPVLTDRVRRRWPAPTWRCAARPPRCLARPASRAAACARRPPAAVRCIAPPGFRAPPGIAAPARGPDAATVRRWPRRPVAAGGSPACSTGRGIWGGAAARWRRPLPHLQGDCRRAGYRLPARAGPGSAAPAPAPGRAPASPRWSCRARPAMRPAPARPRLLQAGPAWRREMRVPLLPADPPIADRGPHRPAAAPGPCRVPRREACAAAWRPGRPSSPRRAPAPPRARLPRGQGPRRGSARVARRRACRGGMH